MRIWKLFSRKGKNDANKAATTCKLCGVTLEAPTALMYGDLCGRCKTDKPRPEARPSSASGGEKLEPMLVCESCGTKFFPGSDFMLARHDRRTRMGLVAVALRLRRDSASGLHGDWGKPAPLPRQVAMAIDLDSASDAPFLVGKGSNSFTHMTMQYELLWMTITAQRLLKEMFDNGNDPKWICRECNFDGNVFDSKIKASFSGQPATKSSEAMEFFDDLMPTEDGVCSDNSCPCSPSTPLPRGTGYLYVSKETVEFRRDAKTVAALQAKCDRLTQSSGSFMIFDRALCTGVLVCERGARLRNFDLEIAAADARHWWKTGKIPLRPTPLASETSRNV